ncbi:hypothetical protein [Leptospira levettii]|uniref:hypothetical protein n=1 Tax=Leptospira levettii TaxID=2023178 RepID=UPI003EBA96A0
MPKQITKVSILLISPSDVAEEREAVIETINNWNAHIGKALNTIVEVLKWETHSVPELGDEPQKILNRQIVDAADFGLAIFWSKLGTETSTHQSGSIEEIDELLKTNKKVLVYFCKKAIPQENLTGDQFSKLQDQKLRFQKEGLLGSYDDTKDLMSKIQLNITSIISEMLSYNYDDGLISTNTSNKNELSIPKLVLKTTIAVATSPVFGKKTVLSIDVQNHSNQIVYLGNLFFKLDNNQITLPTVDCLTGESQRKRILNPGEKFNFNAEPKDILIASKPNKIVNVAIRDQIDRIFEGNSEEVMSNLEILKNLD